MQSIKPFRPTLLQWKVPNGITGIVTNNLLLSDIIGLILYTVKYVLTTTSDERPPVYNGPHDPQFLILILIFKDQPLNNNHF